MEIVLKEANTLIGKQKEEILKAKENSNFKDQLKKLE